MSNERLLEIIERQDKYYILGFIQGLKSNLEILRQENEILKNQLEEYKDNYKETLEENSRLSQLWCDSRAKMRELKNQQNEFIKYLENKEKQINMIGDPIISGACCDILIKYKEIINYEQN